MASTYSDRLKLELMATGANANTWGNNTNTNLQTIDAFNAGYLSKDVAGSSNVTLTSNNADPTAEASNRVIEFTGTLTGDIHVFIPAVENNYIFFNNTSGSFTLTVAPTGHGANGVAITQGAHTIQYCTGNKIVDLFASSFGNLSVKNTINIGDNITLNANGVIAATNLVGNGAGLTGVEEFEAGTEAMFVQTSAPTGFTTNTNSTLTECCLQVVSGTGGGTGGTDNFSTVFSGSKTANEPGVSLDASNLTAVSLSAADHTLSTPEIASHTHNTNALGSRFDMRRDTQVGTQIFGYEGTAGGDSGSTGGGGAHSHSLSGTTFNKSVSSDLSGSVPTMDLKHADVIIATKD
jgi:hypothetical protein